MDRPDSSNNSSPDRDLVSHGNVGADNSISSPTRLPVVLVAQFDSQWLSTIILSLGTVGAMVLFITESFTHPSAATMIIPLLGAPIAALVFKLVGRKAPVDCPKCGTNIVPCNSSTLSGGH